MIQDQSSVRNQRKKILNQTAGYQPRTTKSYFRMSMANRAKPDYRLEERDNGMETKPSPTKVLGTYEREIRRTTESD